MQRRRKKTTNLTTSEEKQKLRNATMRLAKVSGKKFCLLKERLILKSLKGRTLDMEKKNHRHHKDSFFVLNYC